MLRICILLCLLLSCSQNSPENQAEVHDQFVVTPLKQPVPAPIPAEVAVPLINSEPTSSLQNLLDSLQSSDPRKRVETVRNIALLKEVAAPAIYPLIELFTDDE